MKLTRLAVRGLTVYTNPEPVSIDLDELGPGLVAVVGKNGAGKTSLLEAPIAALYRSFPTRQGWYEQFSGSDALIHATWHDGLQRIETIVRVDAGRRTTEPIVLVDGQAVTSGKVADYDAEIERRFGSRALVLASVFAAQDRGGSFVGAGPAGRKELLRELLGLAYLDELATGARERYRAAGYELQQLRTRCCELETEIRELPAREAQLQGLQAAADTAARNVDTLRAEEASATAQLERARSAVERIAALVTAEQSARRELTAAIKAKETADALPAKATARAKERTAAIEARKVDTLARQAQDRAEERRQAVRDRKSGELAAAATRRHTAAVHEIESTTERLVGMLAALPVAAEVEERLGQLRAMRTATAAAIELRRKRATLGAQAELLGRVPCTGARQWEAAPPESTAAVDLAGTCPLLAAARDAERELVALAPDDGSATEAALDTIDTEIETARGRLARAGTRPELERQLQATEADRDRLDSMLRDELLDAHEAERRDTEDLMRIEAELLEDIEQASAQVALAAAEIERIDSDLEAELLDADAAIRDARSALVAAQAHHEAAQSALEAARRDTKDATWAEAVLKRATQARSDAEATLRRVEDDRAKISAAVDELLRKREQLERHRDGEQRVQEHVSDWHLLERSLGRNGVQALEIDAAAPEIAALVNDLLASCYDTRFSISIETLRAKRDGGEQETLEVLVYDRGVERGFGALSGGEQVVVGEAIRCAIAILNARKNSVRWACLWRDETAGALDPENASHYVAMLRRARELGGFHQVLFIAHQAAVWEAADVRLFVEAGTVRVDAAVSA